MDSFVPNPSFMPEVRRAVSRALEDAADEAVKEARSNIADKSSSAARAVRRYQATVVGDEPSVRLSIGRGLGRLFEFSKQQNRLIKGKGKYRAGTSRGVLKRHEFFNPAVRDISRRGLDLRRYL